MLINRLPPTIKKNRYDFNYSKKVRLIKHISKGDPIMILKPGPLNFALWLNFRHSLILRYPSIEIFRGSSCDFLGETFAFLNSNSYWVFALSCVSELSLLINNIINLPKKPILLTLILNGFFMNLTSKLDPYAFLNKSIQRNKESLVSLEGFLASPSRHLIFLCINMTYILPLFIVLLIKYLGSLCELFINYNTKLC